MFVFRVSGWINQFLIQTFDKSRLRYAFMLFPAYHVLATVCMVLIAAAYVAAQTSIYFALLTLCLGFVIGIPIVASWHLSCLLLAIAFFGFLAKMKVPFASWFAMELEKAANFFRLAQKP